MYNNILQRSILLFILLFLLPLTISCGDQQKEKESNEKIATQSLTIGLIPEHDILSQKKRYEPLASYLSKKTGVTIELKILSRYGNIIDNFLSNNLDAAFFGSFTGALAVKKLGVQPVARPEWRDGTSTYYGMIFVRKDSGIKNIQDMKGKRFACVDKATTAGWLLPLYYFKMNGVEDPYTWLKECYFTGTHEDSIYDVLNGEADIGAAKNTVFYRLAITDKRILDELEILMESPKVPANSLAFAKTVNGPLKDMIKKNLLEMSEDPEGRVLLENFGAVRFIATSESDYEPVFKYAESIDLDLVTYDYINN